MATKKNEEGLALQGVQSAGSYRPLDSSGNDYADMVGMSALDKAALEAAGQSWKKASEAGDQAGMDAAHRQAEAVRSLYNYSGGGDGSQYIPTKSAGGSGSTFSYEAAPTYVNRYQSQIDDLTRQILNREAFSYDPEQDPTYQQYKESYTRNGERAMQDTLGQVSARTGGLASSYATSAAQQTYDNYMGALADKIPELKQLAYSMYQDEGTQQRANLEMLVALEQGDYAKYADLLVQYNTDRNFDYGVHRDNISDARYADETEYSRQSYANETARSRAEERAKLLAAAGDFSGYRELGCSDADIALLQSAYDKAQQGSGTTAGRGVGSGDDGADEQTGIYETLYQAGLRSEGEAYAWLLQNGYNTTQAGKLAKYFGGLVDDGAFEAGETAKTGDGAVGMNESAFGAAMNGLQGTLMSGKTDSSTVAALDKLWPQLSDDQKQRLQLVLARYGLGYTA